jgi:hypothetical protein
MSIIDPTLKSFYQNFLNRQLKIGSIFIYDIKNGSDFPDRYLFNQD